MYGADHAGAMPGITLVKRPSPDGISYTAVSHLTRNKPPLVDPNFHFKSRRAAQAAQVSAIRLTGTISVTANSSDKILDYWELHLVQLFYAMIDQACYAGQTQSDGYLCHNFASPAETGFVFDGDQEEAPDVFPYAETYYGLQYIAPGLWIWTVILDDHPNSERDLAKLNPRTGKINYLLDLVRQYQVITVLVARDKKTSVIRPLWFLEWGALNNARFHWYKNQQGQPEVSQPTIISSYFIVWEPRLGASLDSRLAKLVANPSSDPNDHYNKMIDDATQPLGQGRGIDARANWDPYVVPPSHFKGATS